MNSQLSHIVIAIDGPAGAGKSTVARRLAQALNFSFLDTGAMYRALTLKALRLKIDLTNEDCLVDMANDTTIDFEGSLENGKVMLDGEDVSLDIRTSEVTGKTFHIAKAPRVRAIMVDRQRVIGLEKNVVTEGRDVTTVVFPEATYKFYLDADLSVRSHRRAEEFRDKGKKDVREDDLEKLLKERDHKDMSRSVGALKIADGAIVIDSTDMNIDQVIEKMLGYIAEHG